MTDSKRFVQQMRETHSNVNADVLIAAALDAKDAKITDLQAQLRIAEKRAEDAEARNDFLITELDILREKARQS